MKISKYLLLLLLMLPLATYCQDLIVPPDHKFNAFVSRDSQGFTWISSSLNGWYRYDGKNFKHVPVVDGNGKKIHGQNIQSAMYDDGNGKLWFSTYDAFHCYNTLNGQIESHQLVNDSAIARTDYQLVYLNKSKGNLWLYAGTTLWKYNIHTGKYRSLPFNLKAKIFAVDAFENGEPRTIAGCLWTSGEGIEILFREHVHSEWRLEKIKKLNGQLLPEITGAVFISPFVLALSTTEGIASMNIYNKSYKTFPTLNKDVANPAVYSISYHLPENRLFIYYPKVGIYAIDIALHADLMFIESSELYIQIPGSKHIHTNIIDNTIWASGTGKGIKKRAVRDRSNLMYCDISSYNFTHINNDEDHSIYALQSDGSIFQFDAHAAEWKPLKIYSLPDPTKQLYRDKHKVYFQLDSMVYLYTDPRKLPKPVFHNHSEIRKIVTHESGSSLWLTVRTVEYEPAHHKPDESINNPLTGYENFQIDYIEYYGNGELGVNYQSDEFWLLNWTEDSLYIKWKYELGADINCSVKAMGDDSYWIGSRGNGLFLLKDSTIVQHIDRLPGNKSFSVYDITPYDSSRIILALEKEVLIYNFVTDDMRILDKTPNANSCISYVVDTNGYYWACTDSLMVGFHPDSISMTSQSVKPYISGIWINNVPYETGKTIEQIDTLRLNYLQNTLDFAISSISYQEHSRNEIHCSMLNYDTLGLTLQGEGHVRYTQMPPGRFTLQLSAKDKHGQLKSYRQLLIVISPPFWKSWWFITASLLLIVAAILFTNYIIIKAKLKKAAEKLARQQALADERDRIAGEVHDDLGGQISSILYLSEEMILLESDTETVKSNINRIHQLSKGSLVNIRDIIFALDNRKSTLADLVKQLEAAGLSFFQDYDIAFVTDINLNQESIMLSSTQKRNITLIVKESFHNIVKHANAASVSLAIFQNKEEVIIRIKDDGNGFDIENADTDSNSGYGLENMCKKAALINAIINIQSGIGSGTETTIRWKTASKNQKT